MEPSNKPTGQAVFRGDSEVLGGSGEQLNHLLMESKPTVELQHFRHPTNEQLLHLDL